MSLFPVLLVGLVLLLCPGGSYSNDAKDPKVTVKLIEMIHKKQYEPYIKELSREEMDVNQPTPKGLLPITEAVKVKNIEFVDALIQYGAEVNVKEPNSEASPLLLAAEANALDIARLLLAYGADPKAADKDGKSAAEFMTSPALAEMYLMWTERGAMAFEDAPGVWMKASEKGNEYWFNKDTKDGRWNMPPSCAWQRVEVKGGPSQYVNYITSQTIYKTPAALCWRKVRSGRTDMWYNWAVNITQHELPDEMPQYMLDEADKKTNVRWYNTKSEETSWEDPKMKSHWRAITEDDKTYYFNLVTGESTWEIPDELSWTKHEHEDGHYYHNSETGTNTWDVPHHESWVVYDHDL